MSRCTSWPSPTKRDDHFGHSVAIDGATAVVGAYKDDDDGTDSGSVYVFDANDRRRRHVRPYPEPDAMPGGPVLRGRQADGADAACLR